jgi:hypothetical protein
MLERLVRALPGLFALTVFANLPVRHVERRRLRGTIRFGAFESEYLELARADESELLVESDRGLVLDDHLERHLGSPERVGTVEQGAGEQLADALATLRPDYPDPAQPRAPSTTPKVGQPDRRTVVLGDQRLLEVEVERTDHVGEGGLVDLEGDRIPLECGGEEGCQLHMRERARRPELDRHAGMLSNQPTWNRTTCRPPETGTQTSPKAVAAG